LGFDLGLEFGGSIGWDYSDWDITLA